MMWPPLYAIPLVAFLAMSVVSFCVRPPLTPRGRAFHALHGLSGVATGATWLLWNAALCGFGRPRPPWQPATPLADIVAGMFALGKEGLAPTSVLACVLLAAGVWIGGRAVFGPSYPDSQ